MFYLIIPLCYVVSLVTGRDHLISLRDYDFVGEDQKLSSLLEQHIALLRQPVDLAEIEASIEQERTLNVTRIRPNFVPKPDHLNVNLQRYPQPGFNVSMDYGEIINLSGEINSSLPYPDIGLPFNMSEASRRTPMGNLTAGRRAPHYWDPSYWHYDVKLVDLMRQNIYMVQNRFLEIQHIVEKYQSDDRFKIAYLFNRLDEWKKDIRTAYHAMSMKRLWYERMHFRQMLIYYEHLLRKDIDVTYSIEFLNHLHGSFMEKMKILIPARGALKNPMSMKPPSNQGKNDFSDDITPPPRG